VLRARERALIPYSSTIFISNSHVSLLKSLGAHHLSLLVLTSTFPFLPFCFKRFLLAFSSSQAQEKKNEEKENHKSEKKNAEKGRSFPSSSHSTLSLLAPVSTFPLLAFCFKCFLLASFSFQVEEKKRKTIKRKKM
jgi:flagellar biosynthesis component FlhA